MSIEDKQGMDDDVLAEDAIPDDFTYGVDEHGMPQRRVTDFVVVNAAGKMVSVCELDEKSEGSDGMILQGALEAEDENRSGLKAQIGPLEEWCIDYSLAPVLWVRSKAAWYNLQDPSRTYEAVHKLARTRFEICSRFYLLCTTLEAKQTTFKNIVKLLGRPFGTMLAYKEDDITRQAPFILDQAQSLDEKRLLSSGFIKGLRDRLQKTDADITIIQTEDWTPPETMTRRIDERLVKKAGKILGTVMKHKLATAFLQPVDPIKQKCPNYFEIVKVPMDLGTVMTAFKKGMYSSTTALVEDVRLVWNNCRTYNSEDADICRCMQVLHGIFESRLISATKDEVEAEKKRGVDKELKKIARAKEKDKHNEEKGVAPEAGEKSLREDQKSTSPKAKKFKKKRKMTSIDDQLSVASLQPKKLEDEQILPVVEEEGVEYDESRICTRVNCEKNARVGSRYCSDRCGLQAAYKRLRGMKNKNDKKHILLLARRARLLEIDTSEYLRSTGTVLSSKY